jgi:RNA processing factor Prp31
MKTKALPKLTVSEEIEQIQTVIGQKCAMIDLIKSDIEFLHTRIKALRGKQFNIGDRVEFTFAVVKYTGTVESINPEGNYRVKPDGIGKLSLTRPVMTYLELTLTK